MNWIIGKGTEIKPFHYLLKAKVDFIDKVGD